MGGSVLGQGDGRQGAGRRGTLSARETQFVSAGSLIAILRSAIRYWALGGGMILVALVLITAASAVSNLVVGKPFTGEYELAKHFVAIAIFAFLPYCQLVG